VAPKTADTDAPKDPLEDETRQLREAHGALQSGDPAKALKLLDEQATTYASGQLREERTAARVLVLCKLGKVDLARAKASEFLRDNPQSPLADRVRGGCPAPAP
jgi:RNA polymerase sigma-70 factor (ECF subfamily)